MTKKELQELHAKRMQLQQVETNRGFGSETRIVVQMSLSKGQLLCLRASLEERMQSGDAIASDLFCFFAKCN